MAFCSDNFIFNSGILSFQGQYMAVILVLYTASSKHRLKASCFPFVKQFTGKLNYPLGPHYQPHCIK